MSRRSTQWHGSLALHQARSGTISPSAERSSLLAAHQSLGARCIMRERERDGAQLTLREATPVRWLGTVWRERMESGTCLRCGAPYEPGDTVCYTCGAPIGETRVNTQPVRVIRAPKPEPATVQPSSQPADHSPTAAQAPPLTWPKAARGPQASRLPRRRMRLLVTLLGSLLVLLALGAAAYELRILNAAPPVAHQTLYHDPQGRFSFQRPVLWEAHPSASGISLSDSDGISTASVMVESA